MTDSPEKMEGVMCFVVGGKNRLNRANVESRMLDKMYPWTDPAEQFLPSLGSVLIGQSG